MKNMTISIAIPTRVIDKLRKFLDGLPLTAILIAMSLALAILVTEYAFFNHLIIAYGDAESHLNIAKRVVSGLTPGMAQLGGIWLPLPHILMMPFIWFDPFWRSGLAGSIVSGIAYVIAALYVYKLVLFLTKNKVAAMAGFFVFTTNPNILYMQSTPMSELPLIAFMLLSIYYFIEYLNQEKILPLIAAAGFALAASLSRYDGWFLVLVEGLLIFLFRFPWRSFRDNWQQRKLTLFRFTTEKGEGELILFATLALIGIAAWFLWGYVILGDPLYFTNSSFSANSQQKGFLARGELPAYHNPLQSFLYYFVTSMSMGEILVFGMALVASVLFLRDTSIKHRHFIYFLFVTPFIFNVLTLFLGQSVIFIPHLTPVGFQWRLFNVRYGLLMVPALAVLFGYLISKVSSWGKILMITLLVINLGFFAIGYSTVLALSDGTIGLSKASHPDAESWIHNHYDYGLVLLDDYGRTMSIIGSGIPMQNIVYIGSRFYWQEALQAPQRRIRWIIMQRDDSVWKALYVNSEAQGRLYKYFHKVYTSDAILIFERNSQ